MSAPAALASPPEYAALSAGTLTWGDFCADFCAEQPAGEPPVASRNFSALASGRRRHRPIFGAPNPAAWRAAAGAPEQPLEETSEEIHGHGDATCDSCTEPGRCDCPCETCITTRLEQIKRTEAVVHYTRDALDSVQQQLDSQWASANLGGPGCPFCDSIFGGCRCWSERAEMYKLQERRTLRADRAEIAARIARGECTCDQMTQHSDYPNECEVCQREEELRCKDCGQLECRPGCCGGCGGCSNCRGEACKRCGDFDDRCCCYDDREEDRESCGCGACEEHRSDDGCW